ncbi:FKBP-type peptidyl-prolyl cis-trans isomerase [Confluentibacter sediminis]|uniref:FKBP-type peptidyl-prolyl cis-trans isomerase n=1 Tax=Confluentibacter sediminis TaxID=2219045 RepID=UPI000DAD21E8|nr:FKBP-type peptidyl-prolyl cis-trans isomerase [Confluentibacter sediminis]
MKNILFLFALLLMTACAKSELVDYTTKNNEDILSYIESHDLNAQKSSSGLYYVINEPGDGIQPSANNNVTVAYKGYFLNGTVFDQSDADGVSFNLQQVIKGWTEGITYFKEGGSGILLVPAHLGYGNNNYNGIPGGSVLIFDVKLISVNQ